MKLTKALYHTMETIFLSIASGTTGAQIALYLQGGGNYPYWLIVANLLFWGVILLLINCKKPENL